MSKNTVKRTQATVQRADTIGTLNEEHIVIDNSLMPSAEELAKYKEIDPDLVRYFQRITDEERNLRHEATRQSLELLTIDNERRHRERMRGQILAFLSLLFFLGITALALYLGQSWLAGLFSTLSIAGIVSAFINGKKE